ncbi:MAG: Smr/MutS family protein [Thermodesulfobacteriota bacterium]|nr:Smr/MutS family protein [Thermodesulfobacteriota bacterium]
MRKKYVQKQMTKAGLPRLYGEDLPFGAEEGERVGSFAEVFDPDRFDQDSLVFLSQKRQESGKKRSGGYKKAKKQIRPQAELDLHGLTGPQAEARTENFIASVRQRGLSIVRIITGRGLHSDGPPVLPGVVEEKMATLKQTGIVKRYEWEKKVTVQTGSMLVWLRG